MGNGQLSQIPVALKQGDKECTLFMRCGGGCAKMEELKAVRENNTFFVCGKTDWKGLCSSVITNMKVYQSLKKTLTLSPKLI